MAAEVKADEEMLMSTTMKCTLDTNPLVSASEFGSSAVIDECLSELAGEVFATQYVQNTEVDQREMAILRIETALCLGEVNENFKYIRDLDIVSATQGMEVNKKPAGDIYHVW